MVYKLKYNSQEDFDTALLSALQPYGVEPEAYPFSTYLESVNTDEEGNEYTTKELFRIGIVNFQAFEKNPDGSFVNVGTEEEPQRVEIAGYHVDVKCSHPLAFDEVNIMTPNNPQHVW